MRLYCTCPQCGNSTFLSYGDGTGYECLACGDFVLISDMVIEEEED